MLKKFPHTYVIVFFLILISAGLTWVIPGGKYHEKYIQVDGIEKKVLEFGYTDNVKQTWQVFAALYNGFERQSGIIVFILIIGGAFWVINSTRSIDIGILSFLKFTNKLERFKFLKIIGVNNIILTAIMLLFSSFGAAFGMSEETIAFIIILVPLTISMGYDSITGVAVVFVAAGLGFAGALLNPFTIGIAQGIAGLPLYSGIGYRFFCWIVINLLGISYIIKYASKVKKNPKSSPVYEEDEHWRNRTSADTEELKYYTPISAWAVFILISSSLIVTSFLLKSTHVSLSDLSISLPVIPVLTILYIITGIISLRKSVHFFILHMLFFTILFLITGVIGYKWFIMEIAALFFALGILSGIAMNYSANSIVKQFLDGVKDILSAALIVGLAGGIIIILENGKVIDTILFYLSNSMKSMGDIATIGMMYVIQTLINVVIPSGSAKAALTMPIMAPFSDLIGISRQATVMAYQFGDGFTNMIVPTSSVLLGVLGVARIPYNKWVKWILPLMIMLIILGFLLLIPTVTMKLPGF